MTLREAAPRRDIPMAIVPTKAEAVYQALTGRILDGTMEPGSTVNQEALAASLGVSITPVREALRRLESDRLVVVERNRTVTVSPLSAHEVQELYAVRLQLDPFAAGLAAAMASSEEVSRIVALAHRPPEPTARGRLVANREFHRAIYRASGNATLAELLDRLWDQTDRYRMIAVQTVGIGRTIEREHQEIAAAIAERNGRLASELMRAHVEATLRVVKQHAALR